MDERIARFRLRDISPLTFANETVEALIVQAEALIEDLHPHARVTRHQYRVQDTILWRRVFAWVEYAQTGHEESPPMMRLEPPAWDERMVDVIRAVEARRAIAARDRVTTAQLALLAGISHIQVGNFVRAKKLKIDSRDSSGYLFSPEAATAFLADRGVIGFSFRPLATVRRKKAASCLRGNLLL